MPTANTLAVALIAIITPISLAGDPSFCPPNLTISPSPLGTSFFGRSIDFDATVVAVGDSGAEDYRGTVAISSFPLTGISEWQDTQWVDGFSQGEGFGTDIAVCGSTRLLVGAPNYHLGPVVDVITKSNLGSWSRHSSLSPPIGWGFDPQMYLGLTGSSNWAAIKMRADGTNDAGVGLYKYDYSVDNFVHEQTIYLGPTNWLSIELEGLTLIIGNPEISNVLIYNYNLADLDWQFKTSWYGASGAKTGQIVSTDGRDVAFTEGGFYTTDDPESVPRLLMLKQDEKSKYVYDPAYSHYLDHPSDILDLSFRSGNLATAIWAGGPKETNRIEVFDADTFDAISIADSSDASGQRRWKVALYAGTLLYDANPDSDGDVSREVRVRPLLDPYQLCAEGTPNSCALVGTHWDLNDDGYMDWCECPGNINPQADDVIDYADIFGLLYLYWGDETGYGDCNGDRICDVQDILIVLQNWGNTCS